ncbi:MULTISPECIES: molybdate ABC transporter permease subunit [unclassified Campylobacter]|uniref:molybdate ABC transporter permease subunit n=1 Tax=unclassified Campylobacter TaxID=2593542 RepID=UPI001D9346E5|nr:molybdate ABC transporter permease subunit [Campylobacter sp. RM9331]MBZ8006305.1 molybdate ABC transporter permease subunit [Campylobacter sp. RM9332]
MQELTPIFLSLKLSFVTTIILFFICLYPAFYLSQKEFFGKKILLSIISLPLVLPPTVLGFYLLVLLSPNNYLGQFLAKFDIKLVFNFKALLIASIIYSMPFMFNPIYSAFNALPKNLFDRAKLLEKSQANIIFRLCLPLTIPSIISASVMSFAHTMGEFGVVMMVGGSVAGETKVASIAVFEALETLDLNKANELSIILLAISFIILFALQFIKQNKYKS